MEIDEFESPAQSAANGVMCAAGGTVVPRDQQCGVLDKVVVTHGITPCMIGRGERHAMVGGSQHTPEAFAVHGREAALLSPERNYGDQPQTGHRHVRRVRFRKKAETESTAGEKADAGGTAAEAATEGKAAAEAAAGEKTDAVWESRHARTASAAARSKPMAMPQRKVRKPRAYNSPTVARRAAAAWPP